MGINFQKMKYVYLSFFLIPILIFVLDKLILLIKLRYGVDLKLIEQILLISFVYFLPSIVALSIEHPRKKEIFLINLLAGYTIIAWFFVLAWSLFDIDEWVMGLIEKYHHNNKEELKPIDKIKKIDDLNPKSKGSYEQWTPNQQKVFSYLLGERNNSKLEPPWFNKIQEDIKMPKGTLHNSLRVLQEKKAIIIIGETKLKKYKLSDDFLKI